MGPNSAQSSYSNNNNNGKQAVDGPDFSSSSFCDQLSQTILLDALKQVNHRKSSNSSHNSIGDSNENKPHLSEPNNADNDDVASAIGVGRIGSKLDGSHLGEIKELALGGRNITNLLADRQAKLELRFDSDLMESSALNWKSMSNDQPKHGDDGTVVSPETVAQNTHKTLVDLPKLKLHVCFSMKNPDQRSESSTVEPLIRLKLDTCESDSANDKCANLGEERECIKKLLNEIRSERLEIERQLDRLTSMDSTLKHQSSPTHVVAARPLASAHSSSGVSRFIPSSPLSSSIQRMKRMDTLRRRKLNKNQTDTLESTPSVSSIILNTGDQIVIAEESEEPTFVDTKQANECALSGDTQSSKSMAKSSQPNEHETNKQRCCFGGPLHHNIRSTLLNLVGSTGEDQKLSWKRLGMSTRFHSPFSSPVRKARSSSSSNDPRRS